MPSPAGLSTKASIRPSAPSAAPTSTPSPSRRSGSSNPNSSTTRVRGGTLIRSRSTPPDGCYGSTPSAPPARSTTSHPSNSSTSTTLSPNPSRERAKSSKTLSGHAGKAQIPQSGVPCSLPRSRTLREKLPSRSSAAAPSPHTRRIAKARRWPDRVAGTCRSPLRH